MISGGAMRFFALRDAPPQSGDFVCRESVINKMLGLAFQVMIYATFWGVGLYAQNPFVLVLAIIYTLPLFFLIRAIWRVWDGQNWVVRCGPSGLMIKFRSYLHCKRSDEDVVVVELQPGEIEWIGRSNERLLYKGNRAGQVRQDSSDYLEIKLVAGADLQEFRRLIQVEYDRRRNGGIEDSPVHVTPAGVIRIQWLTRCHWVSPGLKKTTAKLSGLLGLHVREALPMVVKDITGDPGETRAREDNILALAQAGHSGGAAHRLGRLSAALRALEGRGQGDRRDPASEHGSGHPRRAPRRPGGGWSLGLCSRSSAHHHHR
jgi:hypothetical protein